jgi:pilus assembly protein CpaC
MKIGDEIGRRLGRRTWSRPIAAATIAAALVFATVQSYAQQRIALVSSARTATVNVTLGKSLDVRTDQKLIDIAVGDPTVADVNPLTDHALSILGKKIGTTRVTVYGDDKKTVGIFDIEVSYDTSRLATEIANFSGGGIRVSSVNGRILLSGTAPDAVTLDKAVEIARQFVPDPINTVRVMQPQQIMLEVRFIEVDRNASRELGFQWNVFGSHTVANIGSQLPAQQLPITAAGGAFQQPAAAGLGIGGPSTVASNITGTPLSPVVAAGVLSGSSPFGFLVSQLGGSVQMQINALEQKGLARSLAEPNLVALSGDTASFLAGGQFPVPEANGLGTVTFAYQPYGVGLSFTPTVLRDGLINLVIKPEVSEIDATHTVTVAGTSVPGLITRKASTTLELRDGQSFMLGGLLQNQTTTAQDQLPWVGDVPVLGALFRSSQYQKNETDLVILVTPHLVRPMPPTTPIRTPLDGSLPGNDVDFFLNGQAEVSPAQARLALGALSRPYVGHILDLPKKGGVYVISSKD